jgi:hypothetical protein
VGDDDTEKYRSEDTTGEGRPREAEDKPLDDAEEDSWDAGSSGVQEEEDRSLDACLRNRVDEPLSVKGAQAGRNDAEAPVPRESTVL